MKNKTLNGKTTSAPDSGSPVSASNTRPLTTSACVVVTLRMRARILLMNFFHILYGIAQVCTDHVGQ